MKRLSLWLKVALVVLVLTALTISAFAAMSGKMSTKGQEVTITGKMNCTSCTLSHPGMACPKGCCANCIKAGDPALLVDAKGNTYLLASGEMQVPLMTPKRLAMAGGKVTVKGLLVRAKGIQVIFVDSMKKA